MMVHQLLLTAHQPLLLLLWSGIRVLGTPTTGNNTIKEAGMKTRETFFLSFAFLCLGFIPVSAMGQSLPNTFTANTAAKASEVNENFEYLLERFGGIRETTVNCGTSGTGSGINSAIQNGYNSIVINGICKENIIYDARNTFSPRVLRLRGANNDYSIDKIVDNSSYEKTVLKAWYTGMILMVDNLTISGGDRGIASWSNNTIVLRNIKVDGYKNHGLTIGGSSVLHGENIIVDGSYSGASSSETGFALERDGVAYLENLTITNNQDTGLELFNAQIELLGTNVFQGNGIAINVELGSLIKTSGTTSISNSSDYGVNIEQGGIADLNGLTLNVSKVGIGAKNNSTVKITDSSLTSSSERVIYSRGGVALDIDNTTITGNSSKEAVKLNDGSNLAIGGSTVSGGTTGISAVYNSTVRLQGGNAITGNTQEGIYLLNSTLHQYSDVSTTTISSNTGSEIKAERSFLKLDGVTITGTGGSTEVDLKYGSLLILGSGSSVTGTVTCGNTAPDNGTFVNNSGTSVTTSGC
jgi:hypothetical protein